ncbi:hypothetical protein AMS68_000081 [Peltaster fructicola]|uniref:TauD/TfdA-like domain-containing protein n=1 Tax=Peltaster fructicola TaxID=286661 RepID=A0A6H0XIM6_9PEZI|nr:hypothetical protein AMS68_000081 [Peltaster fructicola]
MLPLFAIKSFFLPPAALFEDTLCASGYEVYDRISEPYQKFLSSLTVTFAQPYFQQAAERGGFRLYDKPRGFSRKHRFRPDRAVHPLVRTNGTTGWPCIFPVGAHISHVNGVTQEESDSLLKWFNQLVTDNHDLQVRFRWQNPNDIAIWDNRSVFHAATFDYDGLGDRFGNRVVGIGEKPFFDPNSVSRREALEGQAIGSPFMVR